MAQTDRLAGLLGNSAFKVPVRAASTAALTLSGEQTVDGVALVTGNRVLVKDQADGTENGIYVVDTGAWSRAKDFDGTYDVVKGTIVLVTDGATGVRYYRITTENDITIGTTAIAFEQALTDDAALIQFLQSGTAPLARTTQDKIRELGRGGADHVGYDATGATDSYTAIANAIASMSDGETLYLTGTPLIGTTLTIAKRIAIVFRGGGGSSSGASHLPATYFKKKSTLSGPAVLVTSEGVKIEGGGIICDAGNTGAGLVIRANSLTVRDFYVKGAQTDGFHIDHASASDNCNAFTLENCIAESNTGNGFNIDSLSGGNANVGVLRLCQALTNTGDGFKSNFGFWNLYLGCVSEGNTGWGANFSNGKNNTWVGGDSEANTAGQMNIQSTEQQFTPVNIPFEQTITDNGYFTKRLDRTFNKRGTWVPALHGSTGADITVTAVTVSGSVATMTSVAHGYSNGDTVFQTGMPNANLHGTFVISGVAADTYDITYRSDQTITVPTTATGLSATARKCGAYTTQVGRYVYKGGKVEFDCHLITSSTTNLSGNLSLLLPFSTDIIADLYTSPTIGYMAGVTATDNVGAIILQDSNWFCQLWEDIGGTPGSPSRLQGTALGTVTLTISGSFYVVQQS